MIVIYHYVIDDVYLRCILVYMWVRDVCIGACDIVLVMQIRDGQGVCPNYINKNTFVADRGCAQMVYIDA